MGRRRMGGLTIGRTTGTQQATVPTTPPHPQSLSSIRTLLRSAGRQRKLPREKRKWQPKKLLPRLKNPPKSNNSSKTKRRLELLTSSSKVSIRKHSHQSP